LNALLNISDLHFAYVSATGAGIPVLKGLSFDVQSGQIVRIVGPNGCGKSTLLDLIAGRLTPSAGTISLNGESPTKSRVPIAYLRQKPLENVAPNLTVGENLAFASDARTPITRARRRAFRSLDAIEELLSKYDMSVAYLRWDQGVGTLSGGQMQWLGLAMMLLTSPTLLLLDEPTAFLDVNRSEALFHVILKCQQQMGCTILLVSHDAVDSAVASAANYKEHHV